ncbi:MAG: hypothetical protein ACREPF_05070 [Rhodanobacteraceae bacterium]
MHQHYAIDPDAQRSGTIARSLLKVRQRKAVLMRAGRDNPTLRGHLDVQRSWTIAPKNTEFDGEHRIEQLQVFLAHAREH